VSLTHAFSKELGPRGITVNAVAPGVIETDMTTDILRQRGSEILSMTPLGRIGQPEDIAGIVAFLASPEAAWITGRTILADGGLL
jgi:3-oxoacyl-[acyl-carrier protein] reductase